MSTKPSSPELRPNRYDALVVLVVLALAAALAVRPFLAARAPQSGALTVVVSADGQELDRLPLAQFGTHTYANNGYTLTVTAVGGAVSVTQSDCPGQDCVHSGAVSRAGQSIVCLPARIVVELVGAADGHAVDREPRQSVQRDHHQHGGKSPEQREKERRGVARKEGAEQTAYHKDGECVRRAEGIERVDRHDVREPELHAGQRQQRREKGLQIGERERQRGKHGAGRDSFR